MLLMLNRKRDEEAGPAEQPAAPAGEEGEEPQKERPSIGGFFGKITGGLGGIGSFFKKVLKFFESIGRAFQNLGGKIADAFRILGGVLGWVFMGGTFERVSRVWAGIAHGWGTWGRILGVAVLGFLELLVIAVAMVLSFVFPFLAPTIGPVAMLFSTCREGPRSWYLTPSHHAGNRTGRVAKVLCMARCPSGYAPSGPLCRRVRGGMPLFCPEAGILSCVVSGERWVPGPVAPPPSSAGSPALERHREACRKAAAAMTPEEAELVEAACWQPRMFGGRVPELCYQLRCGLGRSAEARCSDMRPPEAPRELGGRDWRELAWQSALAFGAGCAAIAACRARSA